jgi:archaellum component FlaC
MNGETRKTLEERLRRLRAELEERKSSIPIHSIRPHQLIQIEELEEEIEELEKELGRD